MIFLLNDSAEFYILDFHTTSNALLICFPRDIGSAHVAKVYFFVFMDRMYIISLRSHDYINGISNMYPKLSRLFICK